MFNQKFKKLVSSAVLGAFVATTGSVLFPASALAAPYRPYPHPVQKRAQGHNNLSKTGKGLLIAGAIVGITSAIVGSVKHHKANKKYKNPQW